MQPSCVRELGLKFSASRTSIAKIADEAFMDKSATLHLARRDGLDTDDFCNWFLCSADFKKQRRFTGQIICWNENIEY